MKLPLTMSSVGERDSLGRTIIAYRGHITRIINELDPLLLEQIASKEVVEKHSSLVSIFEKLKRACAQWYHLSGEQEDRERITHDYAKDVYRMQMFENKYKEWLNDVYTPISRGVYGEGIANISGFDLSSKTPVVRLEGAFQGTQNTNPSVSRAGARSDLLETKTPNATQDHASGGDKTPSQLHPRKKSSKGGSQLSARNVKCTMAQLKVKRLLAEQEIKESEIALRLQEENTRLSAEKERLNIRSELMLARIDAEQAEIEAKLGEQVDFDSVFSSEGSVRGHENVRKYLEGLSLSAVPGQPDVEKCVLPETKPHALPEVKADIPEAKNVTGNSTDETTVKFQRIMEQQQMSIDKVVLGLEKLDMPKREFLYFDGDPSRYPRFIKNFELNVESSITDDNVRLSYLIQYCTGKAKEAIENCVILPGPEGYKAAREILRKNFGQRHVIIRSFIDKVVKGPQLKSSDGEKLLQLARDMRICLLNSAELSYQADINSLDTLKKIVMRLPVHMQAKWADESGKILEMGSEPTFSHLADFLEKRALIANTEFGKLVGFKLGESRVTKQPRKAADGDGTVLALTQVEKDVSNQANTANSKRSNQRSATDGQVKCKFCDGRHELEKCFKFRDKRYIQRKDFVRKQNLCENCLKPNHIARRCRSLDACLLSGCRERHHSLLHPPNSLSAPIASNETSRTRGDSEDPVTGPTATREDLAEASPHHIEAGADYATNARKNRISLRIVPVRVSAKGGREVETYAFIDDGSDTTLCLRRLLDELGVRGSPTSFSLTTINAERTKRSGEEVSLTVRALSSDECIQLDRVWTVDKLPVSKKSIPSTEDIRDWPHLQGISIPKLDKEVSILIGNDVPEAHWVFEERRGRRKQPCAARTLLGWTLIGPVGGSSNPEATVSFLSGGQETLSAQIERMYNAEFGESSASSKEMMSIEDRRALAIMERTVQMVDGHYQLSLPWKYDNPCLPNNRPMAEKRLNLLKRRLEKNKVLQEKYKDAVEDYIAQGHARKVSLHQVPRSVWYLPHHPVIHPQKPEKTRVVFDCAAKFRNTSLNEQLLQGPDLTNNLVGVLLRFRQEQIGLTADIEKMFHQVRVSPQDTCALSFLWWPGGDLSKEAEDHEMLVHLFGAKSSPSCASFALKKTAEDNKTDFDVETIDTVNRNFYVDDCVKSVATTEEAVRLVEQLPELLSRGGFRLTKWISNRREILSSVAKEDLAPSVKNLNLDLEDLPLDRALGMQWDTEEDTFGFRTIPNITANTRREILSVTSSLYDPLGLAAPVILPAKRLLQKLCKDELGWDDIVQEDDLLQWQDWTRGIIGLTEVAIPRCVKPRDFGELSSVQLHHFSDASEEGYGAVSYLRLTDALGNIACSILLGKARVAPLKTVTVPRLELTAATVAVKLHKQIKEELTLPIHEVTFWTDSTIVLQYINNSHTRFQTFVSNRLATIHDISTPSQWRHVSSDLNPADYASRGFNSHERTKLKIWLEGPRFLLKDESQWPNQPTQLPEIDENDQNVKRSKKVQTHAVMQDQGFDSLVYHYSSWYGLKKALAWLSRFKNYLLYRTGKIAKEDVKRGELSVREIQNAEVEVIKYMQRLFFPRELNALMTEAQQRRSISRVSGKRLSDGSYVSPLRKLNPIAVNGLIRVGGRLNNAEAIDCFMKHPIVLPTKHHVTDMIIRHYHQIGHVGSSQVLAAIRRKFWILKGGSAVRRVVSKCIKCRRWNSKPEAQIMAPLPMARVTPGDAPFTAVGIDYFGPMPVKLKRSRVKRYGCIFTCLTMRAVHIEVSQDLTTDSFLMAFSRFVSRRGAPTEVYSDNGTNFKGAECELKKALKMWNQSRITESLRKRSIQWYFNPPQASHQGGVWERMIRSVRKILRALLGNQIVNDETLLTVMAEVEKILNDRPLTRLSEDPNDLEPLTPNHLLLSHRNACVAPGNFSTASTDKYKKCWRQAQYLSNIFWRRWVDEYLLSLQERQKWIRPRRNVAVGDLVLIADEHSPRGQWPMGVVEEVTPDRYGAVRQATVRTARAILKRDIRKICLLLEAADN